MYPRCLATAALAGVALGFMMPTLANTPAWESWAPAFSPPRYDQAYQPPPEFASSRPGMVQQYQMQRAAYSRDVPDNRLMDCRINGALSLPDPCIRKTGDTHAGLMAQAHYLQRQAPGSHVAPLWANISNAALLETARELLDWHEGISPGSFLERFSLREISANGYGSQAEYTGYFTPVLDVRTYPDSEYRFPIYKKPAGNLARLSHAEIAQRGLSGKSLEIAWTNDPLNLYFAQVQGSGIARFPDGHNMTLTYAGDNGNGFRSIADYMKQQHYRPRNYGNEGIREWLRGHPEKLGEVLTYNPRYIYFNLTDSAPKTASGNGVIPGHTVAVDKRYIPLGSVLLAEVPRIDGSGREVGSDWRLLFAQDQGKEITGLGRFDLYTGAGAGAENIAHGITGFRKTYLLVRKDGLGRAAHIAGL